MFNFPLLLISSLVNFLIQYLHEDLTSALQSYLAQKITTSVHLLCFRQRIKWFRESHRNSEIYWKYQEEKGQSQLCQWDKKEERGLTWVYFWMLSE